MQCLTASIDNLDILGPIAYRSGTASVRSRHYSAVFIIIIIIIINEKIKVA